MSNGHVNNDKELSVAVIIEWENVLSSEINRCEEMLRQLRDQVVQLSLLGNQRASSKVDTFLSSIKFPIQALLLFDSDHVVLDSIVETVERIIKPNTKTISTKYVAAPGLDYYQLKNYGASKTESDIVVFLDSDVIPENDWLINLLGTFADPEVSVVGGNAFIDPYNLYAKAFAVGWFFEMRSNEKVIKKHDHFFANNVAFKKEVIGKYNFPKITGSSRGSCRRLAEILLENNISVYRNPNAKVKHPPPKSENFWVRGFAQGRDYLLLNQSAEEQLKSEKSRSRAERGLKHWAEKGMERMFSIVKNRSKVNLPLIGVPFAFLMMGVYYINFFLGYVLTLLFPQYMKSHFKI